MTTLAEVLRACADSNVLGSILAEAADLLVSLEGDCGSLGDEIERLRNDLETIRQHDEEQARLIYWTRVEFEAYLSSIGLPRVPAASTGNEHLDWLTDHLPG